jgi:FkbM family methyltransferase
MFSQLGQDVFVAQLLRGMRGGFFVDSGASDGVRASNTRLLETSFDWQGICIEPDQTFFTALVRNRRCQCINCCLYDREGTVDFVEANTLGGILQEYHPRHLEYATGSFRIPKDVTGRPKTVPKIARTIRSILKECVAPRVIDYWSLDTEGSELAILKSFPFDEYSFRVLTVEHNRLPVRQEIRQFLEGRGYQLIKEMGIDDCYAKDVALPLPSWRSKAWDHARRRTLQTRTRI